MKKRNIISAFFVELSRLIVGGTFLFSGFVKAVDPLGFAYKIQDYLISLSLTDLFSMALPMAVIMIVAEFSIGVFVLAGIYRKVSSIGATLFMAFFLPLTLWIAIKNPVEDCGCFGDAWVIDNWTTFYKNIVLSICTVIMLFNWRKITPLFSVRTAWAVAIFGVIFGAIFSIYNIVNLPVLDFRPYKIGENIASNMYVDPAKADIFENIFIYSKNGEEKEFSGENYPWNDSTWTFVEIQTRLVKEGEKPKIEDFSIHSLSVEDSSDDDFAADPLDITEQILSDSSYSFLMISYHLQTMHKKHIDSFKEINRLSSEYGYSFYLVTSSSTKQIDDWSAEQLANDTEPDSKHFHFCHADERVLKTMIRSNPGLMLLKDGNVINKWADNEVKYVAEKIKHNNFSEIVMPRRNKSIKMMVIIMLFVAPLLVIKILDIKLPKIKQINTK